MDLEYDGYTHKFHGDKGGISHMVATFVPLNDPDVKDPVADSVEMIKITMWAYQDASHCDACGLNDVTEWHPCAAKHQEPHGPITSRRLRREIMMWITFDQAFKLGLTLHADVALGKYGSTVLVG